MTSTFEKPHFRLIHGQPVDAKVLTKVEQARRRFGRAFAHEPHSTWKPEHGNVLLRWLQTRGHK